MAIGRYPVASWVSPVAPALLPGIASSAADPCGAPPPLPPPPLLLLLLLLPFDPVLSRSHCNCLSVRAFNEQDCKRVKQWDVVTVSICMCTERFGQPTLPMSAASASSLS
jgi:hypothetical protein